MNQSLKVRVAQATALALLLTALAASAVTVHYVDLNSTNPVSPFLSWSTAATNIQAAVNVTVPGDTVLIAPGIYYQQVSISYKTGLTLIGEPGTVIKAWSGMVPGPPVYNAFSHPLLSLRRSNVAVSGIAFEGDSLGALYVNNTELLGIYFLESGGVVTNCSFTGFREPTLVQSTRAAGILCLNPVSPAVTPVAIQVLDSIFADNELSLFLRGDPAYNPAELRVTMTIKGNTITGVGPAPVWSVGIWIVDGVGGDIIGNTIGEFSGTAGMQSSGVSAYDAAAGTTHGRFIPLQPLNVEGNSFVNNGQHLMMVGANRSRVVNNKFLARAPDPLNNGAFLLNGTDVLASNNDFDDLPLGILVGAPFFGSGWPAMEATVNPRLSHNWFCNVAQPTLVIPDVFGLEERGTETNCPFAPRFQSFTTSNADGARAVLRAWHGETIVLEGSSNLTDWVPMQTNVMVLPTLEYLDPAITNGTPQRFYRAFRP